MNRRIVLDSWAVLAWLQGEPSGTIVRDYVSHSNVKLFLNIINLGEIFYIVGRRFGKRQAEEIVDEIKASRIEIAPADEKTVFLAANIKIMHSISYADAFAVATAEIHQCLLATGDSELKSLPGVSILWLPGK